MDSTTITILIGLLTALTPLVLACTGLLKELRAWRSKNRDREEGDSK